MHMRRYDKNPILTQKDVPFRVNSIFNAGAVKFNDKYLLLCRVEMPDGRSSLVTAYSDDGKCFTVSSQPCLTPADHGKWYEYVSYGVEDPRITLIDEWYYVLYTGYSRYMPVVMLARTNDFNQFEILGTISEPVNKDAVLFPEKIDGYYWKIDRPALSNRQGDMWINRSPDLLHWGWNRVLMGNKAGTWEDDKIGASCPPIKTDKGWLMLYHGVRSFGLTPVYKQGVILLDSQKPWQVIGRSPYPVLAPEEEYERIGDVGNVVFCTGWIPEENGELKIYYSGADTNINLITTSLEFLLEQCAPVNDK